MISLFNLDVANAMYESKVEVDRGISPTLLRTFMKCPRLAYLQSFNVGKYEDNIHFAFGNAFGRSAAHMFEYYGTRDKKLLIGEALLEASVYFPVETVHKSKSTYNLYRALDLIYDGWKRWHEVGYRFHSSETKFIVRTPELVLNGMQDVLLYNTELEMYSMLDFKAIGSGYYYNWGNDVQIPFYTLLSYIFTKGIYDSGCYLAAEFKPAELVITRSAVDEGTYRNLEAIIATAKHAYDVMNIPPEGLASVPVNLNNCVRGNFTCEYYECCHSTRRAYAQDMPDTRIVNDTKIKKLSSVQELIAEAKTLAAIITNAEEDTAADIAFLEGI